MAIKSDAEIYRIIEAHLKQSSEPQSSTDLWAHVDVQANARSPEKVSDYLGHMWRRGLLQRWAVPSTSISRARYAYSWRGDEDSKVEYIRQVPNEHRRPNVTVTEEENRIVLDFDKFTMTIQAKG